VIVFEFHKLGMLHKKKLLMSAVQIAMFLSKNITCCHSKLLLHNFFNFEVLADMFKIKKFKYCTLSSMSKVKFHLVKQSVTGYFNFSFLIRYK